MPFYSMVLPSFAKAELSPLRILRLILFLKPIIQKLVIYIFLLHVVHAGKIDLEELRQQFFFRLDSYAECNILITDKDINLGDDKGIQVPFLLNISWTKKTLKY